MKKVTNNSVSASRRLLCNPYAHIEHLEGIGLETKANLAQPEVDPLIQESRRRLEDPYAYLDDSGGYSANVMRVSNGGSTCAKLPTSSAPKARDNPSRRYTESEIEKLTNDLHARLWREKESLLGGIPPSEPIELLDPALALRLVGYDFSLEEGLGKYRGDGGYIEVAGLIDRTSRIVRVSRQFPLNVQTFTAAHELGHALLHPMGGGVHRDRPLNGAIFSRDPNERDADKFATYFLMPGRLVRTRFASLFGTELFELNDHTAFALSGSTVDEILAKCPTLRDRARLLASAERYNGRHFISLADQFRISVEAMAIRLEELGLLA